MQSDEQSWAVSRYTVRIGRCRFYSKTYRNDEGYIELKYGQWSTCGKVPAHVEHVVFSDTSLESIGMDNIIIGF